MIKDQRGFSLIELMVVVCILGVLSSAAFLPLIKMRARGADAAAVSDARNLVVAANESFISRNYPDYRVINGNKIGLKPDGTYAHTLSEGVKVFVEDASPLNAGLGNGLLIAHVYHEGGSPCPNPWGTGSKTYYILVDEFTGTLSAPTVD